MNWTLLFMKRRHLARNIYFESVYNQFWDRVKKFWAYLQNIKDQTFFAWPLAPLHIKIEMKPNLMEKNFEQMLQVRFFAPLNKILNFGRVDRDFFQNFDASFDIKINKNNKTSKIYKVDTKYES